MSLRPVKGWKLGRDSYSKMIVWFEDGNIRTMFSIDWRHRFTQGRDPQIGFERYRRKIEEYGASAKHIEIYDKVTGKLLYKYQKGKAIDLKGIKKK